MGQRIVVGVEAGIVVHGVRIRTRIKILVKSWVKNGIAVGDRHGHRLRLRVEAVREVGLALVFGRGIGVGVEAGVGWRRSVVFRLLVFCTNADTR